MERLVSDMEDWFEDHHAGWFTAVCSLEVEHCSVHTTGQARRSILAGTLGQQTARSPFLARHHREDRVARRVVRIHCATHGLGAELVDRAGCAESSF